MGFGAKLKTLLKEKKMTIKELSEATGISKNTLYSITKRDTRLPSDKIIIKIANALDMDYAELVSLDDMKFEMSKELEKSENNTRSIENTVSAYPELLEHLTKDELEEIISVINFVKNMRT